MTDLDSRLRNAGQLLDEAAENASNGPRRDEPPHQRFSSKAIAAIAAAAAAAAVLAATAWLPDRGDIVVASQDTEQTTAVASPSEPPPDLTVEAAVPRILPGYTFSKKEEHPGNAYPMTNFEFVHESGVELELTIYTFFSEAEMGQQPVLVTESPENKAWLGADDEDLRSIYLVSDSTGVGLRLSSSTSSGGEFLDVENLLLVGERLVELPATVAAAQPRTEPALTPDDEWGPLTVVDGAPSTRRALTTGTLSIDENCVTLTDPDGQQRLLIWPSQATAWDASSGGVLYVSNGKTVTLTNGETVSFGGGSLGSASELEYVSAPHASCPAVAWLVGGLG